MRTPALLAATASLACSLPAPATVPIQLVIANKAHALNHPKSAVPGFAGAQFTNVLPMYRSPTTNQWITVCTTDMTPANSDQVLVIGSGMTFTAPVREGVTEFAPGETIDFSTLITSTASVPVPRLNDHNQWSMAFRPTQSASGDERVIRFNGTGFDIIARTGSNCPAFTPASWTSGFVFANISNAGSVAFVGGVGSSPTTKAATGGNGTSVLIANNATVPLDQAASGTQMIGEIESFFQNATGSSSMALCRYVGAPTAQKVAVADNHVVAEFGASAGGMASAVNTISEVWMESNGDWFVRGANADAQGWILKNGVPIARTGEPIVPGSSETWSSLTGAKGNNFGDYVVIGGTSNADSVLNQAMVLNGCRLIARESDGVDLNDNGVIDDGLYVNNLRADRFAFGNDHWVYVATTLKASATTTTGLGANASLLRVDASYCAADLDNGTGLGLPDNAVEISDLLYFLAHFESGDRFADVDDGSGTGTRDGGVNINDLLYFLARFEAGC